MNLPQKKNWEKNPCSIFTKFLSGKVLSVCTTNSQSVWREVMKMRSPLTFDSRCVYFTIITCKYKWLVYTLYPYLTIMSGCRKHTCFKICLRERFLVSIFVVLTMQTSLVAPFRDVDVNCVRGQAHVRSVARTLSRLLGAVFLLRLSQFTALAWGAYL